MASLKEVKGRINSINGTLKITSAMKMVASAKLHKAQEAIENMLPYERRLHRILTDFLAGVESVESAFTVKSDVKKVAIVVFASNSSLCGGFNANVIRRLHETVKEYAQSIGIGNVLVYPVGRKVAEAVRKAGYVAMGDFQHLSGKPNYDEATKLAEAVIKSYLDDEVQEVVLLYNHFKSTSSQVLTRETYLPVDLIAASQGETELKSESDYLVEPSAEVLVKELLPKVLRMKIYSVVLDSAAAEHAARTIAMQVATDNANDLIQELTLQYNKTRQQAITNELLDIAGGSMA